MRRDGALACTVLARDIRAAHCKCRGGAKLSGAPASLRCYRAAAVTSKARILHSDGCRHARTEVHFSRKQQSIFFQMRERITGEISSGALECGDRLPSVRELGEELDADPRVVLAAYEQLAEEGLVEIRPRSGMYVTGVLAPAGHHTAPPSRWIRETLVAAVQRDIPIVALGELIDDVIAEPRLRAALIECNTDQINSMRAELERYFGLEVASFEFDEIDLRAPARQLRDADVLISAGHNGQLERIASVLGKPFIVTKVRAALVGRLARLLARGPVYFLVVDTRFRSKMRRLIAPMPDSQNFHVLVVGESDLQIIPPGAPTYVMRDAGTLRESRRHAGRVIAPQRIFSEATSREIVSRILERKREDTRRD